MNAHSAIATAILFAASCPALAQEPQTTLPPIEANAVRHVFDCEERRLPSQRDVGEWTGQHNFSQVYETRARLMGEVARACHGAGIEQVNLVLERRQVPGARSERWVARVEPRR